MLSTMHASGSEFFAGRGGLQRGIGVEIGDDNPTDRQRRLPIVRHAVQLLSGYPHTASISRGSEFVPARRISNRLTDAPLGRHALEPRSKARI